MTPAAAAPRRLSPRLLSVDALRGLTVAAMVLVNNPGTWHAVYPPLDHAAWHGWTPTDMVFPFFLFIVGVAIPLALGSRLEQGGHGLLRRVLWRSLVIFALGLLLHAWERAVSHLLFLAGIGAQIMLLAAAIITLQQ